MRRLPLLLLAAVCQAAEPPAAAAPAETAAPLPAATARAFLGVALDEAASAFSASPPAVLRVEPGSPAAVLGIAPGDRIAAIDGIALASGDDLARTLSERRPGQRTAIAVLRSAADGAPEERIELAGVLQETPRSRAATLGVQVAELQQRIADLRDRDREPTLPELLGRLQELERDLPRTAAAFKKVYPKGVFRLSLSLEVSTDASAEDPLLIDVGGLPTPTPAASGPPQASAAPIPPPAP